MFNNTQNKPTRISLAMIGLLSALALTACGGGSSKSKSKSNNSSPTNSSNSQGGTQGSQGGTQGSQGGTQGSQGSQGSTQNAASPLNATYYGIEQDISNPDVSKRYIDVNKIVIDNGKVTQSTTYSAMGTYKPNNSNPGAADRLILAENFRFRGPGFVFLNNTNDFMDSPSSKIRFYSDKIEYVLIGSSNNLLISDSNNNTLTKNILDNQIDLSGKKIYDQNSNIETVLKDKNISLSEVYISDSNNNTLTRNILGKHINLSGQKVYDQKSKIETELKDKNGSVSEVYPQGAGCWAIGHEGMFSISAKASKPYWQFVPIYPSSLATFSDWQNAVKQDLSNNSDSYIDGAFTDVKVGLNNEYNAQMVKIKTNDTKQGIKTTTYKGAIEYEGKIYRVSPIPHPNSTIEIDPKSPYIDEQQCVLYNDVAKDYIIAQLKTLP